MQSKIGEIEPGWEKYSETDITHGPGPDVPPSYPGDFVFFNRPGRKGSVFISNRGNFEQNFYFFPPFFIFIPRRPRACPW